MIQVDVVERFEDVPDCPLCHQEHVQIRVQVGDGHDTIFCPALRQSVCLIPLDPDDEAFVPRRSPLDRQIPIPFPYPRKIHKHSKDEKDEKEDKPPKDQKPPKEDKPPKEPNPPKEDKPPKDPKEGGKKNAPRTKER